MSSEKKSLLLKPNRPVGIVGYGAYVPQYRLPTSEIARIWSGSEEGGTPIQEKSVPGLDEDTITMAIEAARNAMTRSGVDARQLRAVWVGSESHPYAVKPSVRQLWRKPSVPRPTSRQPIWNSPAKPAPKPW